jgi:energy-coupling factor transport system substrate-specific component
MAFLVQLLKLPIYLDSVGTILASVLIGPVAGASAGVVALVILSVTAVPSAIAYCGTAVAIAVCSSFFARFKFLANMGASVLGGILLGIISGLISAPVTAFVYRGASLVGADIFTVFFKAAGRPLLESVILGGVPTDCVDKVLTSLLCYFLLKALPARIAGHFTGSRILFAKPE